MSSALYTMHGCANSFFRTGKLYDVLMNDRDVSQMKMHHREIMTDYDRVARAPTLVLGHQVQHPSMDGYVQSRDGRSAQ